MPTEYMYVAKHPDAPGYYAGAVDEPAYKKENAKLVSKWMRDGAEISRVTCEDARIGFRKYVDWKNESLSASQGEE